AGGGTWGEGGGALGRVPRGAIEELRNAGGHRTRRDRIGDGGGRLGDRREPAGVCLFLGALLWLERRLADIGRALLRDDERRERRDQQEQDHTERHELHGEGIHLAPRHHRRDEREGVAHEGQLAADADNAAVPVHVVPVPYRTEDAAMWR